MHDPPITLANFRGIFAIQVSDRYKCRQYPLARGIVKHHKISLVTGQGCRQHLGRQLEKLFRETAGQGNRPFDQRGDLFEQGLVQLRLPAQSGRLVEYLLANDFHAAGKIDQHLALFFEQRRILRRFVDFYPGWRHEPMTAAGIARSDTAYRRLQRLVAELHQHPVYRPDKLDFTVTPAHAPGYRKPVQAVLNHCRQKAGRGPALFYTTPDQPGVFTRPVFLDIGDRDAALFGKRHGCPGRFSILVVCNFARRPAALDFAIGLLCREAFDQHGKPPRRGKRADRAMRQAGLGERVLQSPGESFGQVAQRCWR